MKSNSYHFVLQDKSDYKDLAPVFPDILKIILSENGHFVSPEEEESREMFIELNMADLEKNSKPEGYNRKALYRLLFPIGRKEFYIKTYSGKMSDVKRIGEMISEMLSTVKVKFEVKENFEMDF